jgi:hypothetical protein
MSFYEIVWVFKTARFRVALEVFPDDDLDLSWDDDGSIREGLENGHYVAFVAKVAVYLDGHEIGSDYLGGCVYESVEQFRDHVGCKAKGYGSYFSDMVREAIKDARLTLADRPTLRAA